MSKTFILCFVAILFGSINDVAATSQSGVKSFVADVPDTVMQGEPFVVSYKLTARSWNAGARPLSGKGFCIRDVKYSHKNGKPYSELKARVVYVTSRCGDMELPGMTVTIGTQTVRPDRKTIYVKPNREYGEEMAYAHDFLLEQGKHRDSLCLSMTERNKYFFVFEDLHNRAFCLVARKAVWHVVGDPVLAYSTESTMNLGNNKESHNYMREPYNKQIEAMLKSEKDKIAYSHLSYLPQSVAVEPQLGQLMWGQDEPYNRFSPTLDGKKTAVGCVPLATAMVTNYHQWPNMGHSHIYYQTSNKEIYKLDYSLFKPQWASYKESYKNNDSLPEVNDLAKLITFLGLSIDANFKNGGTSAKMINIKPVLSNNMGYTGKIAYYYGDRLNEELTESLLYYELDHKRPCIVSCEGHTFVCDGYKNGFFHYNLGWYGSYNGYYRLKLCKYQLPKNEKSLLLIKEIVCGIEPQRGTLERDVTLTEAGALSQVLTDEEKENLTSLKINGPLNSSDIIVLRKMLGAHDDSPFTEWRGGSLRNLNLENASIVSDKMPYLTEKASGGWTYWESSGNYSRTVEYKFDEMTEKTWKKFKSSIGAKQEGLVYTRKDDNTYWANYICQKNIIGKKMFSNCSSLHEIVLPQNSKMIDDYAFLGCISMQVIKIPKKVKEVGETPFHSCIVLEKVIAPQDMTSKGSVCENCSPVLQKVDRY